MSENKTQPNNASVESFIASITDDQRRADGSALLNIMRNATGVVPTMWGPSIVGFGSYHYRYESGREGDTPIVAFSPRKQALTLYGLLYEGIDPAHVHKLGTYTHGKGCIYIKRLTDIDTSVLSELVRDAYQRKSE